MARPGTDEMQDDGEIKRLGGVPRGLVATYIDVWISMDITAG